MSALRVEPWPPDIRRAQLRIDLDLAEGQLAAYRRWGPAALIPPTEDRIARLRGEIAAIAEGLPADG